MIRRLPIYGERDVDAAIRSVVDDSGYGARLVRYIASDEVLVSLIDGDVDVGSVSIAEADCIVREYRDRGWRKARAEHKRHRTEWLLPAVSRIVRRGLERHELDHAAHCETRPRGGVYALGNGSAYTKIGQAKNIRQRISELQCASPVPLVLLAVLSPDTRDESRIHKRWDHLRGLGEWFRLEPDLLSAIDAANAERAAMAEHP